MKLSRRDRRKIVAAVRADAQEGSSIRDARRAGRAMGRPILETQIALGDLVVTSRDFVGFIEGAQNPWVAIKKGTVGTVVLVDAAPTSSAPIADVLFPGHGLASRTSTRVLRSVTDTDSDEE